MSVNLNSPLRADQRGWGPGWPHCQTSKIVPLEYESLQGGTARMRAHDYSEGEFTERLDLPAGVRPEVHDLAYLLLRESELRGYINLVDGWCWGFACRAIKTPSGGSTTTPSNHSWGLALDLNAPRNGFGASTHEIPAAMGDLWNAYGWRWGGDYSGTKDWMHFEFMGTPADARALTKLATNDGIGEVDDLTPEQEKTIRDAQAFLAALTEPLKPGKDSATPAGAGLRVAQATLYIEAERG